MPTPSRPHADDLPAPNDTAFIALAAKDRHTTQGALARHVLALSTRLAAVEARDADIIARSHADSQRWHAMMVESAEAQAAAERLVKERDAEIADLRAKVGDLTAERDAAAARVHKYEQGLTVDLYPRVAAILGCTDGETVLAAGARVVKERDAANDRLAALTALTAEHERLKAAHEAHVEWPVVRAAIDALAQSTNARERTDRICDLRVKIEAYATTRHAAETAATIAAGKEIDALRAKLADETQRRVNAESHRDVAVAEMAKLKADLARAVRELDEANVVIRSLVEQSAANRDALAAAESRLAALTAEHERLKADLARLTKPGPASDEELRSAWCKAHRDAMSAAGQHYLALTAAERALYTLGLAHGRAEQAVLPTCRLTIEDDDDGYKAICEDGVGIAKSRSTTACKRIVAALSAAEHRRESERDAVAGFIYGHAKRLSEQSGADGDELMVEIHDVLNHLRADEDGEVFDGRAEQATPTPASGLTDEEIARAVYDAIGVHRCPPAVDAGRPAEDPEPVILVRRAFNAGRRSAQRDDLLDAVNVEEAWWTNAMRRALATVGAGLTVAPVAWSDEAEWSDATMGRLRLRAFITGRWMVRTVAGVTIEAERTADLATAKAAAVRFAASINGATAAPPAVPREKVDELMRDRAEAIDRDALLWAIVALTDVLEVTWKDPGMATRAVAAIDAIVKSGTPTATLTAERLAEAIEKCPFWIATGELRPDGTHESMQEDDAAEEILRHLGPVAPPAVPEAGDTAATIAPSERQVVLIERRPDGSMVALTDSAPWPVGAPMPMLRWPPPSPPGYTHGAERAAPVAAPTPEVARTVAVAALRGLIAKWRRMTDRAGYTVEAGLAEDGCANDLESLIEAALSDACANSPARPCSR